MAKFFVVEREFLNHALQAAEDLGVPRSCIVVLDEMSKELSYKCDHGEFITWNSLLQHGKFYWQRMDNIETAQDKTAMRIFTSGSSGFPKAVDCSHYGLVAHVNQWDNNFGAEGSEV